MSSSTPPPTPPKEKVWVRPQITIRTPRLFIRPLQLDDVEDIFAIRSNPDTMKWGSSIAEIEISQSYTWLEKCKDVPNTYNFAIELLPQFFPNNLPPPPDHRNKVIGTIGSHAPPEIGYCLNPLFFDHGYATEALRAFMPVYFSVIAPLENFEYAEANTDPENRASHRVLEKCGFNLWKQSEGDYQSPMLGLRGTWLWRVWQDGVVREYKDEEVEKGSVE